MYDELLKQFDLTDEDLDTPGHSGERDQLIAWINDLQQNQLTVEKVLEYIVKMRDSIEKDLAKERNTQYDFLSMLCFFIPIVGIIRKWYQDQRKLELEARLQNYLLLEAFLSSPEKAKQAIRDRLKNVRAKVTY